MGKLTVPRPNTSERAAFRNAGITLIESLREDAFLTMAVNYLNEHNVLYLSTCRNNQPRCTPLEYFNNGLTVYILSEGGGKIANIRDNPHVSYAIADPYTPAEDFFGASGMQVWGIASVFKKNDDPKRFDQIRKYSRTTRELDEQGVGEIAKTFNFNVITIEPVKIRRLSYRQGYRNVIWHK